MYGFEYKQTLISLMKKLIRTSSVNSCLIQTQNKFLLSLYLIFILYKHKIYLTAQDSKFKNAYAMLLAFENDEKLSHDDVDLLLIGLIATNLFYA